ncbi:hypothetical protein ACF0H5_019508 [Mactra antiquata]
MNVEELGMNIDIDPTSGSLWNQLKVKLDEELIEDQVTQVRYLMKDKISPEAFEELQKPNELLTYLENNMDAEEAWTIVEHVFRITKDHFLFETKSIADILSTYRQARVQCTTSSFLGRADDVSFVLKELNKDECKGVWIHGFGGLGKSSLAGEVYATLSIRGAEVTWVDMKWINSPLIFARRILELAVKTNVISSDLNVLLETIIFSETSDRCILLDNIEDVLTKNHDETIKVLNKCLEKSPVKVKWIVTCRLPPNHNGPVKLDGKMSLMQLKPLNETTSTQLLKLRAKPKIVSEDDITSTLKYTGGNPLAINLVGKLVKDDVPFVMIESRIKSGEIAEILDAAYNSLDDRARKKLVELSVVGTSNFDANIARAIWNISFHDTVLILMDLTTRHLIQRNDRNITSKGHIELNYCTHPLVACCLEDKQASINMEESQLNFFIHVFKESEKDAEELDVDYLMSRSAILKKSGLCSAMLRVLSTQKFTTSRPLTFTECKFVSQITEVFHVSIDEKSRLYDNVINNSLNKNPPVFWRVEKMAMFIDDKQTDNAAKVLAVIESDLTNNEHVENFTMGIFWYHKGRYFRLMKKFYDALRCLDRALDYFKDFKDNVRCAETLNAKGNVFFDNSEYEKAKKAHEDARNVLKAHVKTDHHPDMSTYDFNIGTVCLAYAEQKRRLHNTIDNETRELYETAVKSFNESLKKDIIMGLDKSSQYSTKLDNTANCYFYLGHLKEAISKMKEFVEITDSLVPSFRKLTAYFRAGKTYMDWYYDSNKENNRQLLKETAECFNKVEIILNDHPDLDLNLENKKSFLKYYRSLIQNFSKHRRTSIEYFLERYEKNTLHTTDTSSDSSEYTSSSPESSYNHSDEAIGDCENNDIDRCDGIEFPEMEKRESAQFERNLPLGMASMYVTSFQTKKRAHSASESD